MVAASRWRLMAFGGACRGMIEFELSQTITNQNWLMMAVPIPRTDDLDPAMSLRLEALLSGLY